MASHEPKALTYTTSDTTHTFTDFVSVADVVSYDGGYYIDFDRDIDADSMRIQKDIHYAAPIACKVIHIKGIGVGGTAYIIGIKHAIGHTPMEPYTNRGGIDV